MIDQYHPVYNYSEILKEFSGYFSQSPWLSEYIKTEEFETKIGEYLGLKHCSCVNNGTISLSIALLAGGIKKDDNVVIPDLSMIATANAVKLIGANPIFVDIDKNTLCIDTEKAKSAIKKYRAKVVIYVTLNGRSDSSIIDFYRWCRENNVFIIEDSAQSFGSAYSSGVKIGNLADVTSFSFSPHKVLPTGQGGCLVTNNSKLYYEIEYLKDFGRASAGLDIHPFFGINSKFTDIQAIIGLVELKYIDRKINRKKEIYSLYKNELSEVPQVEFIDTNLNFVTPWFVDIYVKERSKLKYSMFVHGFNSRNIYPPMHRQESYGVDCSLPITEYFSDRGLWLPSSLDLQDAEIIKICNYIKEFYAKY